MEADYGYDGAGRRIAKLVQTYNLQGGRLDVLLREYVYDGLDVATEYEYHNGATAPDVTSYYYANGEKVTLERSNANGDSRSIGMPTTRRAARQRCLTLLGRWPPSTKVMSWAAADRQQPQITSSIRQEYDPETGLYHFSPATTTRYRRLVGSRRTARQRSTAGHLAPLRLRAQQSGQYGGRAGLLAFLAGSARDKAADLANRYVVQPARQVVEAAKEVAKDAADVVDRYVVKPAVKAVSKVKEEVSKRYQHVKTHVKQKVREVNDRYVKPRVRKRQQRSRRPARV